ncbi:hypothetical protein B296_00015437 [Ensete ventricosum]|uniref:Uncharacterized protein n=1 Tax=Ensete ventricosum TaxID=4639 RepID=A0A426Z2P7_ENSVE|nr:hypothetical protein B296_00015437 [Ensete ventricosum]
MQQLLSFKKCTRVIELEEIWQIVQLLQRNYGGKHWILPLSNTAQYHFSVVESQKQQLHVGLGH